MRPASRGPHAHATPVHYGRYARVAHLDIHFLVEISSFVTRVTAEALLRREDATGLAAVASALAGADDNHADWIHSAVHDVFTVYAYERDAAVRACETMIAAADLPLRQGAAQLRDILIGIAPVLRTVGETEPD